MKTARPNPSAHSGFTEWLLQRTTALYLAGFLLYVMVRLGIDPPADFTAWRTWFDQGLVRIAWAVAFASLLIHAWTGLRSVFIDYLRSTPWRFICYLVTALGLLSLALWCVQLLLSVGGGP
ncbi:MAG: succinate dehydrogenase, hydrophobic membrane anchor protein [Pseudomonadota bacterium]